MLRTILIFGGLSVIMLILFQLEKWSLFALGGSEQLYIIISGVLFLITGMLISKYFFTQKKHQKKWSQHSSLTEQELKVLHLIAEGKSNKEIGNDLFIAETTVKSHVSNILSKLNAKRRTEAVRIGREIGIV